MSSSDSHLITLRIGLFFDGTANNTYSALWGKNKLDAYETVWKKLFEDNTHPPVSFSNAEKCKYTMGFLPAVCFDFPKKVSSSAANEISNVQKLYELYQNDTYLTQANVYSISEYITGVGTGNDTEIKPAKERLAGNAFGRGCYGVTEKARQAVEQVLKHMESVAKALSDASAVSVSNIEFDAFGFSRGSAAARHFINQILADKRNKINRSFIQGVKAINKKYNNFFDLDFNCSDCITVTFAGLFDTVAAIVNLKKFDFSPHNANNGDVKLWLNPERVKCAIHLTANDKIEYRAYFSINKLNVSDHFYEFIFPGAHSDIGGGYFSKNSFDNINYLLPRLERKLIAQASRLISNNNISSEIERAEKAITRSLELYKKKEQHVGWNLAEYESIEFLTRRGTGKRNQKRIGRLYNNRVVEGDLSRLYLRIMYGFAVYNGVPLDDTQSGEDIWQSRYYQVAEKVYRPDGSEFDFRALCDHLLALAKAGNYDAIQASFSSDNLKQEFMALNLIHHSSCDELAYKPAEINGIYQRSRFDTKDNS